MRVRRKKNPYIFAPEKHGASGSSIFKWSCVFAALALAVVFTINFVMDRQVVLHKETVTVQNLPGDLENWTILHFSDLHGRELGEGQAAIRAAIKGNAYSSVVFTGDMIGEDGDLQPFLDLIALLPEGTPKIYVPGDEDPEMLDAAAHGSLSVYADWAVRLQDAGVILLDEPVCFTRGKSRIWFIPEYLYSLDLDSTEAAYQRELDKLSGEVILSPDEAARKRVCQHHIERIGRIRQVKKEMTARDIQIVLTHVPLTQDYVTTMLGWQDKNDMFTLRQVSLVLAGHYCAGQWRIPGMGALYVPEMGFFPRDEKIVGLEYIAGLPQYISPGLGASSFYRWMPGRVFNSPTVTIIALSARVQ